MLAEQLKQRGIDLGKGKLIPLTFLILQEDNNSNYGAVFILNDKANKEGILDLNNFNWDYFRGEGLSCANLGRGGSGDAYGGGLSSSVSGGRVAVVSGEATSRKILEDHLTKFRQERDTKIAKLQKKYAEREALLKAE